MQIYTESAKRVFNDFLLNFEVYFVINFAHKSTMRGNYGNRNQKQPAQGELKQKFKKSLKSLKKRLRKLVPIAAQKLMKCLNREKPKFVNPSKI